VSDVTIILVSHLIYLYISMKRFKISNHLIYRDKHDLAVKTFLS